MPPTVHQVAVEDRLRFVGWFIGTPVPPSMKWVYGGEWVNRKYPDEGFSQSDALYLEWQEALARAGKAEGDYHDLLNIIKNAGSVALTTAALITLMVFLFA